MERNALTANLVERAAQWPYGSLHARLNSGKDNAIVPLTDPPGGLPVDWLEIVRRPQSEKELAALQRSIQRGCPYGKEQWTRQAVKKWNLQSTLRQRGRPRKGIKGS